MDKSFEFLRDEESNFHGTQESHRGQQDVLFQNVVDPQPRNVIWITEPICLNRRLDKQAGCFVLSGNRERRISDLLEDERYRDVCCVQYRIRKELYEAVFGLLRKMNLNSRTLYGDLDGLGRSIRMELQAYA